jgi:uncharacterized protein
MIPSIEECFHLMDKYEMLENIKRHSIVVARVAYLIAENLRDKGLGISLSKVIAGALLHDIGKTQSLASGEDHCEVGIEICHQNYLEDLSEIVGQHVRLKNYKGNGDISEKEIIFYSDKRVNHDTIVSLEERLAYILARYGRNQKEIRRRIRENFALCRRVEGDIFKGLDFTPDSVSQLAENIGLFSNSK